MKEENNKIKEKPLLTKKSWEEFRNSGFLWFVNTLLHTFGWAIVIEMEDGKIENVYPARVKFRGFNEKSNTEGYIKISKFMKENADILCEEAES